MLNKNKRMACRLSLISIALAVILGGCASMERSEKAGSGDSESSKANAMFERFYEAYAARSPMYLTGLGRKEGKDKWDDLSEEYALQGQQMYQAQLRELQTLQRDKLDASSNLSYTLMQQLLENRIGDYRWRLHNYPVNQMFGVHSVVPSLLINQHRMNDVADADAYVKRLQRVPVYFSQLIDSIDRRTEAGIVAPTFVFAHVIRDSRNIISGLPFDASSSSSSRVDSTLWADFRAKLTALKNQPQSPLSDAKEKQLLQAAKQALLSDVKPAYERLIAHLQQLKKQSNSDAGVWKLPDGKQFYNHALLRTTTTELQANEIHAIGLREVARIHDEMRAIKERVGFTGDLRAFMRHMRGNPEFLYPATAAGRQAYIAEARALIDDMYERLDSLFISKPKAALEVKAVEAFREQSAGKAFYQRPSEDGSRPARFYANMYDMASMPKYQMAALAYHEGIPGHHMQIAIALELPEVPKFRKHGGYTAYVEGWGLYAELLPREIGLYQDPYADFGRLALELWRACRLVVDTGIHALKWTREQSVASYLNNTPNAKLDAIKMVERHVVMPSQATAYKIGMLKILQLRELAKSQLGDAFDIREFHEVVLQNGPIPLDVLEQQVNKWITGKRR